MGKKSKRRTGKKQERRSLKGKDAAAMVSGASADENAGKQDVYYETCYNTF